MELANHRTSLAWAYSRAGNPLSFMLFNVLLLDLCFAADVPKRK